MHADPPPDLWQPGDLVEAQYDFNAVTRDDLYFSKKDILTIICPTSDPNWYRARSQDNREGVIPANYFKYFRQGPQAQQQPRTVGSRSPMNGMPVRQQLSHYPWFHGKISREDTEKILYPRQDGLYLIRESTNFKGDYTLCVCFKGQVEHYHIENYNGRLTIDKEEYFKTLADLVQHYTDDEDGLCCPLRLPLKRTSTPDGNPTGHSPIGHNPTGHSPINPTGHSPSAQNSTGHNILSAEEQQFAKSGWVIDKKDLQVKEEIGKGDFGAVYKGVYRGKAVALKTLQDSTKAAKMFLSEASLMMSLNHPNLVQLLGVVLGDTMFIVTEFMGKGNLVDYLRSRGRSVITKKDQIHFAYDTCAAMTYLEEKKVVHRDLAARNVLISDEGKAKVSDFGLARRSDSTQDGGLIPIKWTAPEALRDNKFTSKSDMWSFGILLWEIYSFGRNPYPRIPVKDVANLVEKEYRMGPPEGCPKEISEIMKQCWELDCAKRPTFSEVFGKLRQVRQMTV